MLYTVQLSAITRLPSRIKPIDITVKSSMSQWKAFAPTWGMVEEFKNNKISEVRFKNEFLNLMRKRYREDREPFKMLASKAMSSDIALACYCPPNAFCHRLLLVDIFRKIEPRLLYMGEVVLKPSSQQLSLFK